MREQDADNTQEQSGGQEDQPPAGAVELAGLDDLAGNQGGPGPQQRHAVEIRQLLRVIGRVDAQKRHRGDGQDRQERSRPEHRVGQLGHADPAAGQWGRCRRRRCGCLRGGRTGNRRAAREPVERRALAPAPLAGGLRRRVRGPDRLARISDNGPDSAAPPSWLATAGRSGCPPDRDGEADGSPVRCRRPVPRPRSAARRPGRAGRRRRPGSRPTFLPSPMIRTSGAAGASSGGNRS